MADNQDEINRTLQSVKEMIQSSRKTSSSNDEILELTEDDLFDEADEDAQDIDDYKKNTTNTQQINQILTPVQNNNNISLEKAIAESIKTYLKEWIEQTALEIIRKELKKR